MWGPKYSLYEIGACAKPTGTSNRALLHDTYLTQEVSSMYSVYQQHKDPELWFLKSNEQDSNIG